MAYPAIKWHQRMVIKGHSPVVELFNCNFSTTCAAFYEISNDTVRRAVPRRQLGFLFIQVSHTRVGLILAAPLRVIGISSIFIGRKESLLVVYVYVTMVSRSDKTPS